MCDDAERPVLILGAGINGTALARELVLNRVHVVLVDAADIASGTTAYSSRLIHGGLRYLEYGEVALVRQSLHERSTLLRQAPHLVRPLRLYIPIRSRYGGLWQGVKRMVGPARWQSGPTQHRGLWLIRAGLWLYDTYASSSGLPKHATHLVGEEGVPEVDATKFPWLCSYYDAQVMYPELLSVAMAEDARQIAEELGVRFQLFTYHAATFSGPIAQLHQLLLQAGIDSQPGPVLAGRFRPAALVNTTGAWVDRTLAALDVPSAPLVGPTRGSHFLTTSPRLAGALRGSGLYAEAADGRPVFFLPLAAATLIGTTDLPFHGDPRSAVATDEEIEYLLAAVNDVFPHVRLSRSEIDLSYAGIRPLPVTDARSPSAITRRHDLREHVKDQMPIYSLIGGKITTCRSVAEEIAHRVLARMGQPHIASSCDRVLPGGQDYPRDETTLADRQRQLAHQANVTLDQVQAIWSLCGARTGNILAEVARDGAAGRANLAATQLPRAFVRWVIRHQWARTVADLVERRLMLLFHPNLSSRCLAELAGLLVQEGVLPAAQIGPQVQACRERLHTHYGKSLAD
jgi:glycerol-3-phosphate dehydrogenase